MAARLRYKVKGAKAPHLLCNCRCEKKAGPMQKTKQVLVVEDDASIRELLTELLETESYHVITAQNGADALALFERKIVHPCLILLDLMMPVMDGPTFLKEF